MGKKIGRPSKYEPIYCQEMIEYMGKGFSYEAFAGHIGVSKQTLYTWEKEHSEFLDAKKVARAACQGKLEQLAHDLVTGRSKGNASMLIFMMKNMTSWRDDPVMDDEDGIDDIEFTE